MGFQEPLKDQTEFLVGTQCSEPTVLRVRLVVRSAHSARARGTASVCSRFTVLLGVARWPLPANGHLASGRHEGCGGTQWPLCYSACPLWAPGVSSQQRQG